MRILKTTFLLGRRSVSCFKRALPTAWVIMLLSLSSCAISPPYLSQLPALVPAQKKLGVSPQNKHYTIRHGKESKV